MKIISSCHEGIKGSLMLTMTRKMYTQQLVGDGERSCACGIILMQVKTYSKILKILNNSYARENISLYSFSFL